MKMNANSAQAACDTIFQVAAANSAALDDYGVTVDEINALDAAVQAFATVIVMPRQAVAQVKTLTAQIKEDIKYIDKVVNKSLSKLMLNFQDSSPVFYADFFNCKRIVNAPTSFTEFDIDVQSNGAPVYGVNFTAVGTTKTYSGSSDSSGKIIKKVSPELYDLHFEIPGYQPVQLNGVQVSPGEHEKLTIELVPLN